MIVLDWRNDPQARRYSRNPEVISPEVHTVWFQSVINNPERHLYIGEHDGELIGQVRFDPMESAQEQFEVSISVDPKNRGQGLAVPLLLSAESALRERTRAHTFYAWVNPENAASQNLFQRAGYTMAPSVNSESHWWVKEFNV